MNCRQFREQCRRALDHDLPLPPGAETHARVCPACRDRAAEQQRVVLDLRTQAGELAGAAPPWLHRRVMDEVRRGRERRAPAAWSLPGAEWALVLAGVILAAGLWVGHSRRSSPPEAATLPSGSTPLSLAAVRSSGAVHRTVADPFAAETDSLRSDLQTTLAFLLDCLPARPTPTDGPG